MRVGGGAPAGTRSCRPGRQPLMSHLHRYLASHTWPTHVFPPYTPAPLPRLPHLAHTCDSSLHICTATSPPTPGPHTCNPSLHTCSSTSPVVTQEHVVFTRTRD
ncbi:hypothetical protein Hamer_G022850 [Homarus americanus]|uniref:Uncharacterized protein n=1 Tax=Homarus americanus TaxID=6706 RepID=A0A8J5MSA4_HOMAM|nr:hypothetical protein Hamer_G022850 [Homarus americanus]